MVATDARVRTVARVNGLKLRKHPSSSAATERESLSRRPSLAPRLIDSLLGRIHSRGGYLRRGLFGGLLHGLLLTAAGRLGGGLLCHFLLRGGTLHSPLCGLGCLVAR